MFRAKVSISADVFSRSAVNSSNFGRNGTFFGRLKWLIDRKVRPSWPTPGDEPDPGNPGESETGTPGRTPVTAHAFRMT